MLLRKRSWTDDEVQKLKKMYTNATPFHDLLDQFPCRSPNSIRLMASRLGLKRPNLFTGIDKVSEKKTSATFGGGVLVRCSHCGAWIGGSKEKASTSGGVIFESCGVVSLLKE